MGVRSPLSATFNPGPGCKVKAIGTDLMDAWLAKHSNACTINKIDLGTPASPNFIHSGHPKRAQSHRGT